MLHCCAPSTAAASRTLTFNRPEKGNSYNGAMLDALHDEFARLGADPAVRAIVLRGNGKHFCAGAEIGGAAKEKPRATIPGVCLALDTVPKPTIALVHGACIGGAVALVCLLRRRHRHARRILLAAGGAARLRARAAHSVLPARDRSAQPAPLSALRRALRRRGGLAHRPRSPALRSRRRAMSALAAVDRRDAARRTRRGGACQAVASPLDASTGIDRAACGAAGANSTSASTRPRPPRAGRAFARSASPTGFRRRKTSERGGDHASHPTARTSARNPVHRRPAGARRRAGPRRNRSPWWCRSRRDRRSISWRASSAPRWARRSARPSWSTTAAAPTARSDRAWWRARRPTATRCSRPRPAPMSPPCIC